MLDLFDFSFHWIRFLVATLFSIISFLWLRQQKELLIKFYFIGIISLIFIYCGVGAAWGSTPLEYLYIYCIYMIVLGLTCHITIDKQKNIIYKRIERETILIDTFIRRFGNQFVVIYVAIPFLTLVISGNISNLISPPSLSLTEAIDGRFDGEKHVSFIESFLYYIQNLVMPFYLVSLYKYKNNIIKLSIALLLPFYFNYASTGYLSRSGTLPFLIMIFIAIYQAYPRYRKKLVYGTFIGLPILLFGLSWYTFARQGVDIDISFGDAIMLLVKQETNYPMHYEKMQNWSFDGSLLLSYLNWLITLPLPGFLKSTGFDYSFTAIFSERITGTFRTDTNFNILLPGLVGESVFILGKTFYWVHAIIVGWVITTAYKLLRHKQEFFLVLYLTFYSGLSFARAGSTSIMPFYFKHLIIYLIVIYFVTSKKKHTKKIDI